MVNGSCHDYIVGGDDQRSVGLDIPREIDKLSQLSAREAASNMDVEGWSGDAAHTIPRRSRRRDRVAASPGACCWPWPPRATSRAADDPPSGSPGPGRGQTEPDTPHHGVKRYEIGQGPRSYFIFEPDKPKPEGKAPVVVFLHGWFAVNPGFYGAWIDHLVRDGRIVIFPRYQNDVGTMPQDFLPNALAAIRDALGGPS